MCSHPLFCQAGEYAAHAGATAQEAGGGAGGGEGEDPHHQLLLGHTEKKGELLFSGGVWADGHARELC